MNEEIAGLRKDYAAKSLSESDVSPDAISQFSEWWNEARNSGIEEVNAMTLATASVDGMPSARIVLLKDFSPKGFVFFTNYNSYKGMQLEENPKACLVFFWKELERQVRVTGLVKRLPAAESDAYFSSRPRGSQLGAVSSPQSQVIPNRAWIEEAYQRSLDLYGNQGVERPANWGGYVVQPVIIEFWQGRKSRLHDRLQYSLAENGKWKMERLAP